MSTKAQVSLVKNNMDVWTRVLVLCAFIVFLVNEVSSIKCWVCRSDVDPRCMDPFDNTTLPIYDCQQEKLVHLPGVRASMCRKIRQKVYGNWRFIRSCAFLGSPGEGTGNENYCTMRSGTYNVFMETCTCDSKDGCNSAPLNYQSFATILLGFVPFLFNWNFRI